MNNRVVQVEILVNVMIFIIIITESFDLLKFQEKESELKELREKLAQQEISTRTLGDQMRQEAQEQV